MGLGRGDRVAIVLPNGPEMAAAFMTIAASCVSAPLNQNYRTTEFDFYLSDPKVSALITLQGLDSPAIESASKLNIPIIELIPDAFVAGLFQLSGRSRPMPARPGFDEEDETARLLHPSGTT
jgi:acyl-CoA synthetase (AMP-forming)/AMP-acid ligase II